MKKKSFSFRRRIFEILENNRTGDRLSKFFNTFLMLLIILNICAIILESVQSIEKPMHNFFKWFEIFSVLVFTVEYLLRLWTADLKIISSSKIISIFRYMITPMAIIDLLAIFPFYLPFLIKFDLRFLRVLRLTRLLRLFKIKRYFESLNLIGKILKEKKEELFITIFVTFILIIFASTLMFYIEGEVQPEEFPDILTTFWWAISTLTTIGYGDVYPITGWGRLLSGFIAILGIGLVALPTGILSSGFVEELGSRKKKAQNKTIKCPHCGKEVNWE